MTHAATGRIGVRVKLFAAARQFAGCGEADLELPRGATAADVRTALGERWPQLEPLAARSLLAVNAQYVGDGQALCDGDEVALIPPVSGG